MQLQISNRITAEEAGTKARQVHYAQIVDDRVTDLLETCYGFIHGYIRYGGWEVIVSLNDSLDPDVINKALSILKNDGYDCVFNDVPGHRSITINWQFHFNPPF